MVRFNCLMASAQTGKNQSQLLLAFVGVLLLFELFLITPCCVAAANKLVIEEGSNIDLIFTLKKDGFVFIKLHKNNEVIFGIEGAAKYNKRSKPINVTAVENTTIFTITDVDSTDDGEYKCFKSGVLQEPQYLVTVILPPTLMLKINDQNTNETVPVFFANNTNVIITCSAIGSKPKANISWSYGGKSCSGDADNQTGMPCTEITTVPAPNDTPVTYTTVSTLNYMTTKDQEVVCIASIGGDKTWNISVNISVSDNDLTTEDNDLTTKGSTTNSNTVDDPIGVTDRQGDTDQNTVIYLVVLLTACVVILGCLSIIWKKLCSPRTTITFPNRERAKTDNSTVEMTDTTRGGSISRQSISHRTLPNIPVRPDLPKIPSDGNVSDGSNESENYYITTDESPKQRGVFGDKDICFIMNIKLDQWHSRWMGTIPANKGTKKCVVLTTVTDEAFRRKDIHWDEFVKRTLDLPVTKYLVKVEGIGILKAKLHLVQEHFACETLDSWLVKVFSQETFENTMYLSEVMGIIAGLLEGLNLIHSYGFLHPGLSSRKILRIEKGQCKLYDFCLSEDASKITTFRKTKVPYSLNHFPPEALHRNEYSQPSDVWAAAGVIWEVITGQLPFPWSEDGPTFEEQCGAPSESQVTHYEEIRNKQLYQCWHQVCPQRPTIRELRESYQEIFEKLVDNTYEIPRMDLYTSMKSSTIHNKDGGEVYTDTYTAVP